MKKTIFSIALAGALLGSSISGAYAEEISFPQIAYEEETITLTLEEVSERMKTTGQGYDLAVLNKEFLEAAIKGQDQAYKLLINSSTLEEKTTKITKDYYRAIAPLNFQAELNNLELKAVTAFVNLLQTKENFRIAKENLEEEARLNKISEQKLKLGMISKLDKLSSDNALFQAQSELLAAEKNYNNIKMAFNLQLGYPLMANTEPAGILDKMESPDMALLTAIKEALNNRNEVKQTEYNLFFSETERFSYSLRYPTNSATYKSKEAALLSAQIADKNTRASIEMEIKNLYMSILEGEKAIEASKLTLINAEEALKIAELSYNLGLNTQADVHRAANGLYYAKLGLVQRIADYNLNVLRWGFATGIGTTPNNVMAK